MNHGVHLPSFLVDEEGQDLFLTCLDLFQLLDFFPSKNSFGPLAKPVTILSLTVAAGLLFRNLFTVSKSDSFSPLNMGKFQQILVLEVQCAKDKSQESGRAEVVFSRWYGIVMLMPF